MDPFAAGTNARLGTEDDDKRGLEQLKFVARAAFRHWRFVMLSSLLGIIATVALLRILPKTYRVQTQLLARRQQMLPGVARPSVGDESPTAGAYEAVHRRENLVAIIRKAGLLDRAPNAQPSRSDLSEEERQELLIRAVDQRLAVFPGEGTLTIAIDWPDGAAAYRIVDAALQDFLERRRMTEIAPIEETVSILEARAASMLKALIDLQDEARKHRPAKSRGSAAAYSQDAAPRDPAAVELEARLRAKQQAVNEVEEYRRRKVTELRGQLTQEQTLYGPDYPSLVNLKESIEALSQPSSQLASLREEQRALEAEYHRRFGRVPRGGDVAASLGDLPADARDEATDALDSRLKRAAVDYQAMLDRVGSARIELETARAGFKYRYSVLWPAQIPRQPAKPNPLKILALGSFVAVLLSVAAAAAFDLFSGRIVERAQVDKLGLLVLGEIRRPG